MFPSPEGQDQSLHILLWCPKYLKLVFPLLLDEVVNMHRFCCTWNTFLKCWFELTTATPAAWTRLQLFPSPRISALMGEVGNYCQLIKGLGSWRSSKTTPQALLCSGELCLCTQKWSESQLKDFFKDLSGHHHWDITKARVSLKAASICEDWLA